MRTWVKLTIAGVLLLLLGFGMLAGAGAYLFFRHLDTKTVVEADTKGDFETVRTRFASRAPLIQIVDPKKLDIRIDRVAHPEGRRANTIYVLTWTADDDKLLRTDVPLWLMRFSSVNILSHLGIAPDKYRLTAEDIARFGPGIIVDYNQPGDKHVLIWVE